LAIREALARWEAALDIVQHDAAVAEARANVRCELVLAYQELGKLLGSDEDERADEVLTDCFPEAAAGHRIGAT